MKNILAWLNDKRRAAFKLLSGRKIISATSHIVLVLAGTLAPAYLAHAVLGPTFGILTFFIASELWVIFMTGREVLDYSKRKAKSLVVEDIDETWQDGLGDLVGPYFVHGAGWMGMLWLIFGGGP